MKSTRIRLRRLVVRVCVFATFISSSLFLFSFSLSRTLADDVWKQFGINQQQATENIKNSFLRGYLDKTGVQNVRNLAIGDRAAVARDVLTQVKTYLSSADFIKSYNDLRNSAKPEKPEAVKKTKEDIRKEKIEETEKAIAETEEFIRTTTSEDMKKAMTESLKALKDILKDYKDPNSATIEMMYQGEEMNNGDAEERYKEEFANWQAEYPENYKLFIKAKLQNYLSVASTVDFGAATVEKNGKTRFVKEAYEAKPGDWKMIFRAGKDVYTVTKSFAEQWIVEIK